MKVLVACEESQAVTIELRKLGHEAYSCDILECSGEHPEWHLQQDVTPLLDKDWDMIIGFPPCTYLSNAGARHLYRGGLLNKERYELGLKGKELFMKIYNAPCPRICVENPTPSKIYGLPEQSCRTAGNWFNKGGKDRQRNRAKTFPGIAKAMAEQWGKL